MKYEKLENMKSFQSCYQMIDNKYYSDNLLANKKLEEQDRMTRKILQNKINIIFVKKFIIFMFIKNAKYIS